MRLNKLYFVIVESIPDTKEAEVPTISTIPDETVDLDKWYYQLKKEDDFGRKEAQTEMKAYPHEEDMEEVVLDDERGSHWRMFFQENEGGRDY